MFYKKKFREAQDEGGILWQHVISFDDRWLKENKIITGGTIDDGRLKLATKAAMSELLKKEGMTGNAYWTGAIHFNTNNIHIHVGMVEKNVKRGRGKLKQTSIDAAKTKVAAHILDRRKSQEEISQLCRAQILDVSKSSTLTADFERDFKKLSRSISQYQYGRLNKAEKKAVDALTDKILKNKFPKTFKTLQKKLDVESRHSVELQRFENW